MKIFTAPNMSYDGFKPMDVTVFLAGGISSCEDWQKEVIDYLGNMPDTEHLVIFNPRREKWPTIQQAIREQIEWEYKYLNECDIASFYFAGGESVQPITMYELGRQLAFRSGDPKSIIITCDENYTRYNDVDIQSELAMGIVDFTMIDANPMIHADRIYRQYKYFC